MLPILWVTSALAADDPPVAEAELQAQLDDLRTEVDQLRAEAVLREAEALAQTAPPAPPAPSRGANAFNPALTAFGDVLTSVGVEGGSVAPGSGPWLRSLELDLRAPVDPFATAVAVIALEQEPPLEGAPLEFEVAAEEVYVDFVSLPAGFSARIGAARQPFGITNRSHPHDWPWPDTPAPIERFLGEEGFTDTGVVATWLAPISATALSVTGGVVRGTLLDPDEVDPVPQWVARGEWFHAAGAVDLGAGGSATGLGDSTTVGGDLVLRWRPSTRRSVVLLAEVLSDLEVAGAYGAVQVQPVRPLFLGVRGDWTDERSALGAYASVYTSEFLRLRAGATAAEDELLATAQLTFVWGAHPTEPYWVNR